jgi:hypothetical protein
MAALGDGSSSLCTSVHDSLSFKRSTQFADVGCLSWKMAKETNVFNFGTTVRIPNENWSTPMDTFFFELYNQRSDGSARSGLAFFRCVAECQGRRQSDKEIFIGTNESALIRTVLVFRSDSDCASVSYSPDIWRMRILNG